MSTINKANAPVPSYPASAASAAEGGTISAPQPVETSPHVAEATPLYRSLMPSQFSGDITGLSMPQNVEDTAILLAKVVAELEEGRSASRDAELAGADANERRAVTEELTKIAEARAELYGDSNGGVGLIKQRSDKETERKAVTGSKSAAEQDLSTEKQTKTDKEAQLKKAQDRSTDKALTADQRDAAQKEVTRLKSDISTSDSKISKLNDKISDMTASISNLNTSISDLDSKISSATQRLELGGSSLVFASARLASARTDALSDQDLDIARDDQTLTHIIEASKDEIEDLRDRIVARFEETRRTTEDLTKAVENDRILATVVGLVTALTDTTAVVRREAGAAQDDEARVQAARMAI